MNQLPGNSGQQANWNKRLINDLSFIKSRLRYPLKGIAILPYILWTVIGCIAMLMAYTMYTDGDGHGNKINIWSIILITGVLESVITAIIIRYTAALKFIRVQTDLFVAENILMIEEFLRSKHILTYRHPEAGEIFQIQSRQLRTGSHENREVILFIVDDKYILINSHHTDSGWDIFPGRRHHRQMAKDLINFINNRTKAAGIMHQNF